MTSTVSTRELPRGGSAGAPAPTSATGAATPAPKSAKRSYLHHLDLIRATTFALVIFVHVLTQTADEVNSIGVTSTGLLLHFTRNTFFALTGFVLTYQYYGREDFTTWSFWRRRIKLVAYPYVIFTAVYFVVKILIPQGRLSQGTKDLGGYLWGGVTGSSSFRDFPATVSGDLAEFGRNLAWGLGGGGFHMYFLFVMVQVYLLFPLLLWLLQATKGFHAVVLTSSLALQVLITVTITHWLPGSDPWWHHYATFIPYQFFLVYGAVAAIHRDAIARALTGPNKAYLLSGLGVALLGTGAYAMFEFLRRVSAKAADAAPGQAPAPSTSSGPFEPTLLPFLIVAIACLYAVALTWGTRWRARTPRFARFVSFASNRSFGVFLVHVLVLFFVLGMNWHGEGSWIMRTIPQPFGTATVYALTLVGSILLVELLRRLPGSVYTTGRPRLPLPKLGRRASAAPSTAAPAA
ncbi:acyltransferase [Gordonia sp. X0973]|uniref:acyltransferase n=1 Tax=Gordonia sp. X0973 TaxID=2742602 RepID=UPI000F5462D2|nr:acyltransferase [Gordonia sp. X0973]QKT08608.1 acyltransferase [Gordonia sp. X0973]